MNIKEFRQKFPQYNDMPDGQLADKFYTKYYADMPRGDFMRKFIGSTPAPQEQPSIAPLGSVQGAAQRATRGYMGAMEVLTADPMKALSNFPSSAVKLVKDLGTAVAHPIQTAKGMGQMVQGAVSMALPDTPPDARPSVMERVFGGTSRVESEEMARQVGRYMKERGGSLAAIKNTIETDPVGALADVAGLAMGGGAILSVAGKASKVAALSQAGKAASAIGRAVDPITMIGKTAKGVGKGAGNVVAQVEGFLTAKGADAFKKAWEASPDFRKAQTGIMSGRDISDAMIAGIYDIKNKRRAAYLDKMEQLPEYFQTPVDITPLKEQWKTILKEHGLQVVEKVTDEGKIIRRVAHKGQVLVTPVGSQRLKYANKIQQWLDPQAKTLMDLDALKKGLSELYETSHRKNTGLLQGVKKRTDAFIKANDPSGLYNELTSDYSKSSLLMDEASRTFSVPLDTKNAPLRDTVMRKMLTAMREDHDFRRVLIKSVEDASNVKNIDELMAGYLLSAWTPGGIIGKGIAAGAGFQVLQGGLGQLSGKMLAVLTLSSPRLAGEFIYQLGRGNNAVQKALSMAGKVFPTEADLVKAGATFQRDARRILPLALIQAGRTEQILQELGEEKLGEEKK
uniref:Uncharacterized protein n=1 Tax=viral metagenome TaxID=1070528 RepID=A0A6M3XVH6_9ZZZZ